MNNEPKGVLWEKGDRTEQHQRLEEKKEDESGEREDSAIDVSEINFGVSIIMCKVYELVKHSIAKYDI